MTRINPALLKRLEQKLGVGPKQVYSLVSKKVQETHLPRHLAAIALASDKGIGITRYASKEDLAELRSGRSSPTPTYSPVQVQTRASASRKNAQPGGPKSRKLAKSVFVVHGRNEALRRAMFALLRAFGLNPIEWVKAIGLTKKPSPYIGEVLDSAFQHAAAIVVLFTPDDEARLKQQFVRPSDPPFEKELTGQSRPNVLFEAGMAYGRSPQHTVLVQVGDHRPLSDLAGRHVLHLNDSPESRREFATELKNAGCNVDTEGQDWFSEGTFVLEPSQEVVRKRVPRT